MNNLKTYVIARLQMEGVHQWKECDIEEVSYLKSPHRHIFHIEAKKRVFNDNREIEFIKLTHQIKTWLKSEYWSTAHQCLWLENKSCEMLAKEILERFNFDVVEVNEDSEGGSIIINSKTE